MENTKPAHAGRTFSILLYFQMTNVKADQPHLITGTYKVTNDFVLTRYYVENAVSLVDMHGFRNS